MSGSGRYTAVLDACVLYPAPVRDLLLSLAHQGLYRARWTDRINEEWRRNLLLNRPELDHASLRHTIEQIAIAMSAALIVGYERYEGSFKLPDPDDHHVVAAAIAGHADAIVTSNLKDFPAAVLQPLGLEVQHPDEFALNQLHLNLTSALKAVKAQRLRLKRPPVAVTELLASLNGADYHKPLPCWQRTPS